MTETDANPFDCIYTDLLKANKRQVQKSQHEIQREILALDRQEKEALAEIKKLVMAASPVVVLDAKTGEDLTRAILLQIILEEESAGVPMFSEAVLSNIIRFYGHSMQGHMGSYLENHVQSFMDWQSKLGESSPTLSPEVWAQFMKWQTPLMQNMFSGLANPSQNVMTQMQEQMQKQIQKNAEQLLGVMGLRT